MHIKASAILPIFLPRYASYKIYSKNYLERVIKIISTLKNKCFIIKK